MFVVKCCAIYCRARGSSQDLTYSRRPGEGDPPMIAHVVRAWRRPVSMKMQAINICCATNMSRSIAGPKKRLASYSAVRCRASAAAFSSVFAIIERFLPPDGKHAHAPRNRSRGRTREVHQLTSSRIGSSTSSGRNSCRLPYIGYRKARWWCHSRPKPAARRTRSPIGMPFRST